MQETLPTATTAPNRPPTSSIEVLSPMALSLVTKLTPKRFVGLTMGGWFFATAVGNKFSGFLGVLQGSMSPSMFFLVIVAAASAVALYILSVLPKLDAAIKKYGA